MKKLLWGVMLCAAGLNAKAGETPSAPAAPQVQESELQRVIRRPAEVFEWKLHPPPPPPKPGAEAVPGLPDMTSGRLILRAFGHLSDEKKTVTTAAGKLEAKEILTLTQDVEIEQLDDPTRISGQKIRITMDSASGEVEMLEAQGNVELWKPEQSGRGESLVYELKKGPNGEVIKNMYTIEGGRKNNGRAKVWKQDDWIEAERFINDQRMNTLRIQGGPVAVITLPSDPEEKPAQPAPASPGGMLPGFNMAGGGKVRLQADGEMNFDMVSGKLRIARNVCMLKSNGPAVMKMLCDEAVISLSMPPPGQPAESGNGSLFAGSLKSLECSGRVDLQAGTTTCLFDKGAMDMARNVFTMEMKNPKDEIKIYQRESAEGGTVYNIPKRLTLNMETQEYDTGGPQHRSSFTGAPPTNRPRPKKDL